PCPGLYTDLTRVNHLSTTEIYTLSLHDALPIWISTRAVSCARQPRGEWITIGLRTMDPADRERLQRIHRAQDSVDTWFGAVGAEDRKSTRLNSSHLGISYAVFCLKKKKTSTMN